MNKVNFHRESHFSRAAALLSLIFATLLGAIAVRGHWESEQARSNLEKRPLALLPQMGQVIEDPAGYFREVDAYLEDHFGFAVWLNQTYRKIRFNLFRVSPQRNVALGGQGFVFLTAATEANPYGMIKKVCQDHATMDNQSLVRRHWQRVLGVDIEAGRQAVLAVPPTKTVLYPEQLPFQIPAAIRKACIAYPSGEALPFKLFPQGGDSRGGYYYPYSAFRAMRFDGNFYPKENFHFEGRSAHRFAADLLRQLGIAVPSRYAENQADREIFADLAGPVGFRRRIQIPEYYYPGFGVEVKKNEPAWLGELMPELNDFGEARAAAPVTRRKALLLSDSFGARLLRHLAPAYAQVIHINISRLQPSQQAIVIEEARRRLQPDDVIYLVSDIFLDWLGEKLHASVAMQPQDE